MFPQGWPCVQFTFWPQFSSVAQFPTLQPHELQPGLPVCHQLPEFTQTHVHLIGDAISSSPLLPPMPPKVKGEVAQLCGL